MKTTRKQMLWHAVHETIVKISCTITFFVLEIRKGRSGMIRTNHCINGTFLAANAMAASRHVCSV